MANKTGHKPSKYGQYCKIKIPEMSRVCHNVIAFLIAQTCRIPICWHAWFILGTCDSVKHFIHPLPTLQLYQLYGNIRYETSSRMRVDRKLYTVTVIYIYVLYYYAMHCENRCVRLHPKKGFGLESINCVKTFKPYHSEYIYILSQWDLNSLSNLIVR